MIYKLEYLAKYAKHNVLWHCCYTTETAKSIFKCIEITQFLIAMRLIAIFSSQSASSFYLHSWASVHALNRHAMQFNPYDSATNWFQCHMEIVQF